MIKVVNRGDAMVKHEYNSCQDGKHPSEDPKSIRGNQPRN